MNTEQETGEVVSLEEIDEITLTRWFIQWAQDAIIDALLVLEVDEKTKRVDELLRKKLAILMWIAELFERVLRRKEELKRKRKRQKG
jgi:hypothetical protein